MAKYITVNLNDDGTYSIDSDLETPEAIVFWLGKAELKVYEDTFAK